MSEFETLKCICGSKNFIITRNGKNACCSCCHSIYDNNGSLLYQGHAIKNKLNQPQQPTTPQLITCPACNQQVSNQAQSCPHCGQPINTKPKCPTCGSTNIEKISGAEKIVSGAIWGLFSTKIRKSYKCNSCKHEW